jgi:hypothetical protein
MLLLEMKSLSVFLVEQQKAFDFVCYQRERPSKGRGAKKASSQKGAKQHQSHTSTKTHFNKDNTIIVEHK